MLTVGEMWNIRNRWRQSLAFCYGTLFSHHLLLAVSSHWLIGRERISNMIGCPFCPPLSFLLLWVTHSFYWCNTNIAKLPLVSPPTYPAIISSPSLSLFQLSLIDSSHCLCLRSTCSHLQSKFSRCSNSLLFFCLPFCQSLFPLVSWCFTSRQALLTYIPASRRTV